MNRNTPLTRKTPLKATLPLSPCGTAYPTETAARSSVHGRRPGAVVEKCPRKEHRGQWHVRVPAPAADSPSPDVRRQVAERDLWSCVRCGQLLAFRPCRIRRRSRWGGDGPGNHILLCPPCDEQVQASPAEAAAAGWTVPAAVSPSSVPVKTFTPAGPVRRWLRDDGTDSSTPPNGAAA